MERDLEVGEEEIWESISRLRKPYLAALGGQWDAMKSFYEENHEQLCSQMTVEKDTAFHIAAYSEGKELLQHLVELLPPTSSLFEALNKKNQHGNNTFHEVATTDGVETADFLVKELQKVCRPGEGKLEDLLKAENNLGETPIYRAVAHGLRAIDKLRKMKRMHSSASELTESLVEADYTWKDFPCEVKDDKTISLVKVDSSVDKGRGEQGQTSGTKEVRGEGTSKGHQKYYHPLLEAASNGIVEIFDKMIESYPQVIEYISNDEENILHVAIGHRQRDIYRRVKKMEVIMKCRLASRIDKNGNTLLHHVAEGQTYYGRESREQAAGPAFQLQEELGWLKRVRNIIPSHYILHCNNKGKTADELFQDTHAGLLELAQKWTKETSQSCSAVSVLVATVVFAAAYTVPGGNDASGRPNFINSPFFVLFTIMDVVSLACSLSSVVMFLSILSSPFEYENFKASLPRKLMIGFTLLFFSVTTTMLSFAATIFLLLRFQKKAWTNTLIYTAAFLPVSMFALIQFPLYAAFNKLLHTLTKKIEKKVYPQKFLPPYLRTKKLNKLS
ncbi:ankyrin repeat-containing protein ITN1-like [Quercus suber]|uniref:ankyrin repeat-containing protein ITN1-like n=1 Tax=Quercus suber TaxID=58331 RepID=UPI0032DE9F47